MMLSLLLFFSKRAVANFLALQLLLLIMGVVCRCGASTSTNWDAVVFDTPSVEPGTNAEGKPVISGGMPIGNGETTALVFPLTSPVETSSGFRLEIGVHIWIAMTTAMASDTALMPLGVVSIITYPSLFSGMHNNTFQFSQTLHMGNATVEIETSNGGSILVWCDANTNRINSMIRGTGGNMTARVAIKSLRPSKRFEYYGRCSRPTSPADEWITNITGGDKNISSITIGLSHRNMDEDIVFPKVTTAYFNSTLKQQGLSAYVEQLQTSDRWRNRQFGFVVSPGGPGMQIIDSNTTNGTLVMSTSPSINAKEVNLVITTMSRQTKSAEEWQRGIVKLHLAHTTSGDAGRRSAHNSFWESFWDRSHIWVGNGFGDLEILTGRYAQTRYVQAIQAKTWVPIKFNGMTFTAHLPPDNATSGPSYRQWGSSNWWQNTRLAYWNMAASGDFSHLSTIFEYYLQMLPFLEARTKAAFNHSGIYVTETKTLFGAYDPCDYGTAAANRSDSDLNFGYEENPHLRYDLGGDAGLTELCVMLMDYYAYTLDDASTSRYMPLIVGTLDFFAKHYGNVENGSMENGSMENGIKQQQLVIFPTQALETYQCPIMPATNKNCPTNDHPTVAALHVLTERALELPTHLSTFAQRRQWKALEAALPPVPMITEDGVRVVSPYETFGQQGTQHHKNIETPELYSTHPFRYFTLGRSRLPQNRKRDIAPSIYCLETSKRGTCRNADINQGWTQGLLNAALLGRAKKAAADTLARAKTPPAIGYRFPVFAPHEQDYEPSEDHFANMNTALQLMLLSPADDGLTNGGALLFPAWPCSWDVNFKLQAPRKTIVSGKFVDGRLKELRVQPPERRSAIIVLPCQDTEQLMEE